MKYLPHDAWLWRSRTGRIITVVFLLGLLVILGKGWWLDRHDVTVTIHDINLPVNCSRATVGLLGRHANERDFVPEDGDSFFCGLVWTDHGPFRLPESRAMPFVQTDRATLIAALKVGCTYKVRIVETATRPNRDPDQLRKSGRIIRILEQKGCGTS